MNWDGGRQSPGQVLDGAQSIPFHSNRRQHQELARHIAEAIGSIDLTDDGAGMREVERFERALAEYCGVESAVAVASGTDAMCVALKALDAPPGSEVITCDFGFYATAAAIVMAELTPVFVDVAPGRMVMDPDAVAAAVSPRTVAVVPVHLFGESVPRDAVRNVAAAHSIDVVEDMAQALGSESGGRKVGGFGTAAGISFNWTKHLSSTSNGGAVLTNASDVDQHLRRLRHYGEARPYCHVDRGFNSKLNPFEAAVLRIKLPYLDGWIKRRRQIAARYASNLAACLEVLAPAVEDKATHVFHKYTIRTPDRDRLKKYLNDRGIGALVCYPTLLHEQPALAGRARVENVQSAALLCEQVLSIPVFPELTDDEVDYISESILSFFG
jgi:UDP-2-acetamido-2-deoxy-ribo-hexuluronate aminotransferase